MTQTYLHSHGEHSPDILFNLVYLNGIVDLLLSTPEKATEGIYKLVIDRACTQVMTLVLHRRHLGPFVFFDDVLLY